MGLDNSHTSKVKWKCSVIFIITMIYFRHKWILILLQVMGYVLNVNNNLNQMITNFVPDFFAVLIT